MENRIDIMTDHLFPFHFIALGAALMALVVIVNPLLSVGLFIIGLLFTSTHYRLMLDTKTKKYKEYLFILGYKRGKEQPFQDIEYIFINKNRSESEYGFANRMYVSGSLYMGYIKLSNGEKLFIGEHKRENKLLKKASKISKVINAEILKNY